MGGGNPLRESSFSAATGLWGLDEPDGVPREHSSSSALLSASHFNTTFRGPPHKPGNKPRYLSTYCSFK